MNCLLQPRRAFERFGFVGAFPGEWDIVAAEVTVGGGLAVDGFAQAEVTDDRAGAQVEVFSARIGEAVVYMSFHSDGGYNLDDLFLYLSQYSTGCNEIRHTDRNPGFL
jgi:hypothetical protein